MTLKDKFDNPIMRHDLSRNEIEETKKQCAKVAEDFAIGFAEWLLNDWVNDERWSIITNIKELLEIYKQIK